GRPGSPRTNSRPHHMRTAATTTPPAERGGSSGTEAGAGRRRWGTASRTLCRVVRGSGTPWFGNGSELGAGEAESAGDEDALDLGVPRADREDVGAAIEARAGDLLHVAVPAVDLHGVAGGRHRDLARVELGDRSLGRVVTALVAQPGRVVRVHPGGLDGHL